MGISQQEKQQRHWNCLVQSFPKRYHHLMLMMGFSSLGSNRPSNIGPRRKLRYPPFPTTPATPPLSPHRSRCRLLPLFLSHDGTLLTRTPLHPPSPHLSTCQPSPLILSHQLLPTPPPYFHMPTFSHLSLTGDAIPPPPYLQTHADSLSHLPLTGDAAPLPPISNICGLSLTSP